MFLVLWYIVNSTEFGAVFQRRLENLYFWEGETASGRLIFQRIGLTHIVSRGIFDNFFGQGMGYSKVLLAARLGVPIGMHSDWLEIAISYGLIGLLCYAYFYKNLLRLVWKSFRSESKGQFEALLSLFFLSLFGSFASGGTLDTSYTMPFALLGFILIRRNMNSHINQNIMHLQKDVVKNDLKIDQ